MTVKEITVGQDSFLDVVANLVGILIILVVVVGAQARVAWKPTEVPKDRSEELALAEKRLNDRKDLVFKLEKAQLDVQAETQRQILATKRLNQVRHEMLVQIEIAEKLLREKQQSQREKLDQESLKEQELLEQDQQLTRKLHEIDASLKAISKASQPKSEVIEHYPNPIAKTVFTEEIHFQIKGGKIVFVPLDDLLYRMKAEAKTKAEQLRQSTQVVSVVGPIRNFQLQYGLIGEVIRQQTSSGVLERVMVQFDGFQLIPSSDDLGLPAAQELDPTNSASEVRNTLQRYPAGKTTVSLWVYPDSYSEYNLVKHWLYEQGYQVACWPLDADKRISGSPSGFRTSAQ